MAFRVMRNKRNQRWTQRLSEIFQARKHGPVLQFQTLSSFLGMGQKSNWLHQSGNNDRNLQDLQSKDTDENKRVYLCQCQ